MFLLSAVKRLLRPIRPYVPFLDRARGYLTGAGNDQWARAVMNREVRALIDRLPTAQMDVLEISGESWQNFPFRSYLSVSYPEYDLCATPLDRTVDLIIAEQVFEHLLWPYRAGRNVFAMLREGGYFLMNTPFLFPVHQIPVDCSRWTELGMRHFLAECGFPLADVLTGSWGNRACVRANLRNDGHWPLYVPWRGSLHNEADFPVVVWALARKQVGQRSG